MKNVNIRLDKVLLLGFLMMILTHSLNSRYRSEASPTILGVSPQDVNYYKGLLSSSSATIKCKDGSNMFSKSQLNDDFCDCLDGSDEPGTSACPNGKFHCKNAGHTPLVLYSSRVNDGICDCCDGSDEYDGLIKCPNTCWEAGKVAREKLKKKIATYKEGVTMRKRDIEHAKMSIAKDEAELSKLKDAEKGLKTLVEQLKERKEEIEKAEEKERLLKEKEEKERMKTEEPKEQEIKAQDVEPTQTDIHDKIGPISGEETQDISESDHPPVGEEIRNIEAEDVKEDSSYEAEDATTDEKAVIDADNKDENVAEDTESLSKEELGRLVASRWTGEKSEHNKEESDSATKDVQNPDEMANEPNDDEDNSYDSEDDEHKYDDDEEHKYDDDEHKYDDDDSEEQVEDFGGENHYDSHKPDSDEELEFSDITGPSSSSSWLKKIQETAKSIFSAVNVFKKPVNISDAAQVRKEYDDSSAKLSKMLSKISSLKQKLKQDFGPEKEFYSFYGQCFEIKQNKYVYKVCPFKQATQEEGYSTTRLGSWDKFEDSYRVMQFLNGDKCWNGPDRSLKVKLRCGLKNELSEVDEPSRCEYLALLSTPALCLDSKLKELQEKLESMNKDQPQGHDEL